jgi:hypothetical protein
LLVREGALCAVRVVAQVFLLVVTSLGSRCICVREGDCGLWRSSKVLRVERVQVLLGSC